MDFASLYNNYEVELIADIKELVSIPSTLDESSVSPGAPFGRDIQRALEWFLQKGSEMGFVVKNIDGYAGHVEYGEGEEILAILAHLDIVPAGEGWDGDPFTLLNKDGKLIGRGVVDNKGPAVMALYALKALKDNQIKGNKRIRLIVGADEESGMRCMKYYLQHEQKPTLGFSPDAAFPLIFAEKGIIHLKATWNAEGPLVYLGGGERANVVPQSAVAKFSMTGGALGLERLLEGRDDVDIGIDEGLITLHTKGKSAHASVPETGDNAITFLLEILNILDTGEQRKYLTELAKVGRGLRGEGLDVKLEDEVSGCLSCNLGTISFENGIGEAVIDLRSPVTHSIDTVIAQACESLKFAGFGVEVIDANPPHQVAKDSELVQKLLKVYREVTSDQTEPIAIGGGTYARKFMSMVAFGPSFMDREHVAHMANEYIMLEDVKVCLDIYTRALVALSS